LSDLSFLCCISPSGRGDGHHIWSSHTNEIDDVNATRPKRINKAKHNDLKDKSRDLTRSAGLYNECALRHFFTSTFPEYIFACGIIRQQNDLATAAPITRRLFMSLTSSSTPFKSSSSQVDNPRSHLLIFTGLWPVRRGRPGI
jgi:hypothetical protein